MKEYDKENLKQLTRGEFFREHPLKKYTSFQIGGPAEVLIKPADLADLKNVVIYLHKQQLRYWILGNGSNLLISDQGLSGVVFLLSKLDSIEFAGVRIKAGAGVKMPKLISQAAKKGLSGLENLAGLPASLGGAIASNAGANDVWISDLLIEVKVLTSEGRVKIYQRDDLEFAYRSSSINHNDIIIEAKLELEQSEPNLVTKKRKEKLKERAAKQPLSYPNAGCIFKNPDSDFAGRLIEEVGAKGLRVGGAQVSIEHANFIINLGQATCKDVLDLINQVEELVADKFSLKLEREIIILGDVD